MGGGGLGTRRPPESLLRWQRNRDGARVAKGKTRPHKRAHWNAAGHSPGGAFQADEDEACGGRSAAIAKP